MKSVPRESKEKVGLIFKKYSLWKYTQNLLLVFCDISKNTVAVIGAYFEKSCVSSLKHTALSL